MAEKFAKRLDRALHHLEDEDPRLSSDANMKQISSNSKRAHVANSLSPNLITTPVHQNLKTGRNFNEDLNDIGLSDQPQGAPAESPATPAGAGNDEMDITQQDLPQSGGGEQGGNVPGSDSGNNYTLEQAKGQLDGIIEKWMDLAGNYPEGEQRHNFLEIGERLREISGVINRDYLNEQNEPTVA